MVATRGGYRPGQQLILVIIDDRPVQRLWLP